MEKKVSLSVLIVFLCTVAGIALFLGVRHFVRHGNMGKQHSNLSFHNLCK